VEIKPVGENALLIEVDDVPGWRAVLEREREAGRLTALEIVPGARTILLDGVPDPDALRASLASRPAPQPVEPTEGRLIEIETHYDGPDLAAVADHWQMSLEAAVAVHGEVDFRVSFFGFAPGFAYLDGLPKRLALPRLATPRTRVPAGSVALADAYGAIYPRESPGGWRLIGHTDRTLFDVTADPPALLRLGDRVRFVCW
jgi:KipI family sensor histidine kinase inhibitor